MNGPTIAIISLLLCLPGRAEPEPGKPVGASHPLVTFQSGDLPIILAAPHGGREGIPGVPVREGKGVDRFQTKSDANTDRLTELMAAAIEKQTGKRPFLVIARFHRKFIDANRAPDSAFESEQAKPVFEAYQQALATARKEVTDRWGRGLLLDIHGQAAAFNTIFRGTRDGKSTTHLTKLHGREALIGATSLSGQMAAQGFHVLPPVGSDDKEEFYNGGHTVVTYGSGAGGTLDAIQLEFGAHHRSAAQLSPTAGKMAAAIASFAKSYLPAAEQPPQPADAAVRAGKVAVGVYTGKGAGPDNLLRVLATFDQVSVTKLTAEQIRSGGLEGLDVLMHPGGSGGGQGRNLEVAGREKIRGFVREGGGFIGICAGAYLATAHYPWSLDLLDAKVIDTQHWNRGVGTVDIELSAAGREVLRTTERKLPIHYAQGPLLAPAGRPDIEDYEELASFKSEVARNGAPEGVMIGTTAIARGRFGQGRVICFSPHPESTKGLEAFVRDAIQWVQRKRAAAP